MVAGELDALITHLRHGRDGGDQVFGAFVAHRIKLQAERNLVAAVFSRGKQTGRLTRRARRCRNGAVFDKLAPGDGLAFHMLPIPGVPFHVNTSRPSYFPSLILPVPHQETSSPSANTWSLSLIRRIRR